MKRELAPNEWVCISVWLSAAETAGIVADGFGVTCLQRARAVSVTFCWK